jgi:hypothetical protein
VLLKPTLPWSGEQAQASYRGVVPLVVSPFRAWRTGVELLLAAIAMAHCELPVPHLSITL